jgi:hypothetical protein
MKLSYEPAVIAGIVVAAVTAIVGILVAADKLDTAVGTAIIVGVTGIATAIVRQLVKPMAKINDETSAQDEVPDITGAGAPPPADAQG